MSETPNRPLPVQLQEPHLPWVKEAAFAAWVAADRNCARALDLLAETWPESEPRRLPAYRTIAAWRERDGWESKADALVAAHFPGLRVRQLAMLTYANSTHIQTINDIAAGLYNDTSRYDPRAVRNMLEAAKTGLLAGGIGTFGSPTRAAPVVRAAVAETRDLSELSEQELAELQQTIIRQGKSDPDVPERKR